MVSRIRARQLHAAQAADLRHADAISGESSRIPELVAGGAEWGGGDDMLRAPPSCSATEGEAAAAAASAPDLLPLPVPGVAAAGDDTVAEDDMDERERNFRRITACNSSCRVDGWAADFVVASSASVSSSETSRCNRARAGWLMESGLDSECNAAKSDNMGP